MAVGQIGLSVSEFLELTFEEYLAITEKYADREAKMIREQWEVGRLIAYNVIKPHAKKPDLLKRTDIAVFPWDEQPIEEVKKKLKSRKFEKQFRKEIPISKLNERKKQK